LEVSNFHRFTYANHGAAESTENARRSFLKTTKGSARSS
jgi:hypothetical protein